MRENPTGPETTMIVDRYDPMNLFEELVPELNLQIEPELAGLDRLLEDDELFRLVKADLSLSLSLSLSLCNRPYAATNSRSHDLW